MSSNFYDGRPVVSTYQAEDVDGNKSSQIAVTFGDDLEPKGEIMHVEEWEVKKQAEGEANECDARFSEATYPLRERILREMEKFNPRYRDLERLSIWLRDDVLVSMKNKLQEVIYGAEVHPSFKKAEEILKSKGKELDFGDATEEEKIVARAVIETGVDIHRMAEIFASLRNRWYAFDLQVLQAVAEIPAKSIRLDDCIKILEEDKIAKEAAAPKVEETKTEG